MGIRLLTLVVSPLKCPFVVKIPKVNSVLPVPSRKSAKKIEFQGIPGQAQLEVQKGLTGLISGY